MTDSRHWLPALLAALLMLSAFAAAVPPPATEFYGNVSYRNGTPFAVGALVEAFDQSGVLCGEFTTVYVGKYGLLSCNGDDDNTTEDEGALHNEQVNFRINNRSAGLSNGNRSWVSGGFQLADLIDNNEPNLTAIGNLNATEDIPFFQLLSAYDPDGDNVTFSVTFLNGSAIFNLTALSTNTSSINFTPSNNDVGTRLVRITVSDGFATDSEEFNFTVINVNDPPFFAENCTSQNVTEDSALVYGINVSDIDLTWGDNLTYYGNTSLFNLSVYSGLLNWTPTLPYGNLSVLARSCDIIGTGEYFNGTFNSSFSGLLNGSFANLTHNLTGLFSGVFSGLFNGSFNSDFTGLLSGTFNGSYQNISNQSANLTLAGNFSGGFSLPLPQSCVACSFNITVFERNDPPVMTPIGTLFAEANVAFSYQVNATDEEGDALTFNSTFLTNVTLFVISPSGLISFTANASYIGTHQVNISVSDNNSIVWELVYIVVEPERFCGDGLCLSPEDCTTCAGDCGTCPPGGAGGAGGGGGAAGGGGGAAGGGGGVGGGLVQQLISQLFCNPTWQCTEWGVCQPDSLQRRTCTDTNYCGIDTGKPDEEQACVYQPATCSDGVQNQDEQGIDCGGICPPCLVFAPEYRYAAIPYAEKKVGACGDGYCAPGESCSCPKDCRSFPKTWPWKWFLPPVVFLLVLAAGLQGLLFYQVRKAIITPKEYRRRSRVLHLSAGALLLILLLLSSFAYFFAYCTRNILKAVLVAMLLFTGVAALGALAWHFFFSYDEQRKLRRLNRMSRNHVLKIEALIQLQGKHVAETQEAFSALVTEWDQKRSRYLDLQPRLVTVHNMLRRLFRARPEERDGLMQDTVKLIDELRSSDKYKEHLELYPRLRQADARLRVLRDHFLPLFPRLTEALRLRDAFRPLPERKIEPAEQPETPPQEMPAVQPSETESRGRKPPEESPAPEERAPDVPLDQQLAKLQELRRRLLQRRKERPKEAERLDRLDSQLSSRAAALERKLLDSHAPPTGDQKQRLEKLLQLRELIQRLVERKPEDTKKLQELLQRVERKIAELER